jgi:caa(3)-type oxidase subunit IV
VTAEIVTHEAHDSDTQHQNHDRVYIQTALVLALITGLETLTYFESFIDFGRLTMPLLLVCMVTKFYLIAANFMHLRWDKPILRRVFISGIIIALVVYMVTLTAFKFFDATHVMPH